MTRMPNFSAGLLKSMKHIESDLRTWNIIMVRNSLYAHGLLLDLCLFCSSRPKEFSTCLACSTINPIAISPKVSRYSCRDRLLFLVETISGTRLQDPPCSWPLHTFFFSNRHSRYILLSPVYIHSSLAIYTRLAYLACMCGVMSVPCAVFADMRFFFSLRYSSVKLPNVTGKKLHFHLITRLN